MGTPFNVIVGQCNLNLLGLNTIHTDLVVLNVKELCKLYSKQISISLCKPEGEADTIHRSSA